MSNNTGGWGGELTKDCSANVRLNEKTPHQGWNGEMIRADESKCGQARVHFLKVCKIYCCLKGHCLVLAGCWEL